VDIENIDVSLLAEIETHAIYFAQEAGQILLEHFRQPMEVKFKDKKKNDPVTTADRHSEAYLTQAIRERFPGHSVLSEEGETHHQADSPFIWIIDPLDGTANFLNGLPLFAVSIGVLWKMQPVVGSIYVPVSHCATEGVYHARLGGGAFFNDEQIEIATEPSGRPLAEIPVQFGSRFRLSGKSRQETHEARNLGSIALELAMVASGVFQYALFARPRLWDVAAGILLVKEAGGLVFTKAPGGKNWIPLELFQPEQGNKKTILENLRSWSSPLIAGTPDASRKVVKDIRIRRTPLYWLHTLRLSRGQNREIL